MLLSRHLVRPAADDDFVEVFEGDFYVCVFVCVSVGVGDYFNPLPLPPPSSCFKKN